MTAIDKFIRLEAVGWWFEAGRQEAREVIVSFGDATLQITSLKDVPLTHWSLLATKRIGTRGEAVIYSADPEQHEVLEIEDPEMIRAISAVTLALAPAPPKRKSRWLWRGLGALLLLGALSQSPPLIYSATSLTTSPARLGEVSDTLRETAGPACKGWLGTRALAGFAATLFPAHPTPQITVVDGLESSAQGLPDGSILISNQALERLPAEAMANQVILAWAYASRGGSLASLIKSLGPFGALRSLISGRFPSPLPKSLKPEIKAEDYVMARDHLLSLGASPSGLQTLASANGIGLPLPQTSLPEFSFSDYKTLQNICVE